MKTYFTLGACLLASALLVACGGGNGSISGSEGVNLNTSIPVPGITPTTNFSFDISDVDSARGRMYFTDRNNKSVDVINIKTNTVLTQIPGFHGCDTGPSCAGANNDKSGPDGLNVIPGTNFVYVGDVNAVKIIDANTLTVVNTINIGGNSGLRADEGCYDPDHKIFMINSPGESPPFATFIDTTTQKIIATLLFTDPGTGPGGPASAGLEACAYDHGTQSFIDNNDGSTANPHGEVDVIPAAFVMQGTPQAPVVLTLPAITPGNGFKVFPLGNCDPTGLALGPGTDMGIVCREGTTGVPLLFIIMDRTNGTILASLNAGGGDQVTYDPSSNRYYEADSRWTANGLAGVGGACTAAVPCTPSLMVIDGASRTLLARIESGNNAHSVAFDPATKQLYMPYSGAAAPAGCATCAADLPNGGVLVYSIP
jgi:DNA-binding beta-propeller fold protein YncE